jgi:hypothetical protein
MMQLEAIHTPAQLEGFSAEADLDEVRAQLGQEPGTTLASLEAVDAAVRAALGSIDRFASTCMRIWLDAALAGDTSVQPPFRRTLAATVLQYVGDLETLRVRVAGSVARLDPVGASTTAATVVEVAGRVLDGRAALRDGVIAIAREVGARHLPAARTASWDRSQDEATRARWAAKVGMLEELLGVPPEDEPVVPEPTRGSLLEYD